MKLKLDENLSRHLKQPLAELGLEVTTAGEEGLLGRPDPEVARAAAVEGRPQAVSSFAMISFRMSDVPPPIRVKRTSRRWRSKSCGGRVTRCRPRFP